MTLSCRLLQVDVESELGATWERLAGQNASSGFMQSLAWAKFKKSQGFNFLHLGLFEDERLIGGMICYIPPGSRSIGMATAPDGPLLNWDNEEQSRQALVLLMDVLKEKAREYSFMGLHAEPRLARPLPKAFRNFARAPYDLLPAETLYLDLSLTEEELLQQMKSKGRYNIQLATQKHAVVVEEENSASGLDTFYELLKTAGERNEFFVEPYSFFSALYESLPAGMLEILVARYKAEPLAVMLLVNYGHRSTYLYGGVANTNRNVMAGYALQWEAIRRARSRGSSVYDFYGYTESKDSEHLYFSFSKFKKQFGGAPEKFIGAQHHLFIDRLADAVIVAAQELAMEGVAR